ncbi:MAG: hypothetical protein ABIP81_06300, partial [Terriglobales bacterium]
MPFPAPILRRDRGHWWPLALLLVALIASNSWFAVFDDEAFIISVANLQDYLPALYLIPAHVHPPAADVFLHFWLMLADGKVWLIRLPFMLFYVLGIWCTA